MNNPPSLRIALLGTRGIPASYGGFETFAEELSKRLVDRGHRVSVFSRSSFGECFKGPDTYKGVTIEYAPTIFHKYLETPLHALTSMLKIFFRAFDVVLLCNAANSPFAWIVRLSAKPIVINVDGIERKRTKWNTLGKLWYRLGEWCSVKFASEIIGDAKVICDYYEEEYGRKGVMIPYGATAVKRSPGAVLERFGLKQGRYILYVSRLEPENNALGVIQAYRNVSTEIPLVIVGDAPYADEYKKLIRDAADSRVIFTGFQFGDAYQEFQSNCYLYIQATEVGGTHPALVESMAYGNCVVANDTPENREVLGDAGLFYPFNEFESLTKILQNFINVPESRHEYSQKAQRRVQDIYSWESVTTQYEQLFLRVLS